MYMYLKLYLTTFSGSLGGGQVLTINGTGFMENRTKVLICDMECEVIDTGPSCIMCRTPEFGPSKYNYVHS